LVKHICNKMLHPLEVEGRKSWRGCEEFESSKFDFVRFLIDDLGGNLTTSCARLNFLSCRWRILKQILKDSF
jgi:hypothetical protein